MPFQILITVQEKAIKLLLFQLSLLTNNYGHDITQVAAEKIIGGYIYIYILYMGGSLL